MVKKKMKTVSAEIKKLGINGEGIAYLDKKITFVQGALPTETVEIEIERDEKTYKIGKLVKVEVPSEHRVQPKCYQQGKCLGCPLMIMDYPSQLEHKNQFIKDTFNKYAEIDLSRIDYQSIKASAQQYGVRGIARLPISKFKDRLVFGIYQRDSKYLSLMKSCPMQSTKINKCLGDLEKLFNDMHLQAYDDMKKRGLRFLYVREFDEGIQLIFITGEDQLPERVLDAISKLDYVASIYVSVNTSRHQDFELQRYEKKYGKTNMEQYFMQQKFIISSKADFPVYRQHAVRVAKEIANIVNKKSQKLIELNCGIGLYSLGLDKEIEIKGVDNSRININDAMNNVHFMKRENADFEYGRIEKIFPILAKTHKYDTLLFHINEAKVSSELIENIRISKLNQVVLVSDHISTLAKVVGDLKDRYQISKVMSFDGSPCGPNATVICQLDCR